MPIDGAWLAQSIDRYWASACVRDGKALIYLSIYLSTINSLCLATARATTAWSDKGGTDGNRHGVVIDGCCDDEAQHLHLIHSRCARIISFMSHTCYVSPSVCIDRLILLCVFVPRRFSSYRVGLAIKDNVVVEKQARQSAMRVVTCTATPAALVSAAGCLRSSSGRRGRGRGRGGGSRAAEAARRGQQVWWWRG